MNPGPQFLVCRFDMKSLASILCLFALVMVGCKQAQEIPTQYEPAFADDGFSSSANNIQRTASDLGNSLGSQAEEAGSTLKNSFGSRVEEASSSLKNTASSVRQTADTLKKDMSDIANQFEPMD